MRYLRSKLSSDSLRERIIWTVALFFVIFFGIVIFSYFFLPEGLLRNKNPLQGWDPSDNVLKLSLQIFLYNLLSVLVILMASLFASKRADEADYLSAGYMAFFTLVCINAVTLGTWSFSVESEAVPLIERIIGSFDLAHRAGLWEMAGQLLITCAIAHIATVLSSGRDTVKRKISEIRLDNSEKVAILIGIVFMLIGAVVEGFAINSELS